MNIFNAVKNWPVGKRIVLGVVILRSCSGGWRAGLAGLKNTVTQAQAVNQQIKNRGRFLADSINLARSAQLNFKEQVQEWKDILLRGNDPGAFQKYSDQFTQREAAVDQDLRSLQQRLPEPAWRRGSWTSHCRNISVSARNTARR